ncbi:SDR family oxidoreductase [Ramlibacter sp.]|uniref:SDR family NAD(P)-dependent oxidoreductase n=1 Tax=Ramlibacter sp. TaxID=1917967 RepID=UPI002CF912BA|nr:SDR family oxidoreductase [Ramlibacter sp.]HWI80995.1 SDR family oxidoreductase [Ramlibacter sp.]
MSEMTAVVTGGASGIGAATARRFAAAGMRVAIVDMNREAGAALAQELAGGASFHACDVGDAAAVEAAATAIEAEGPPVGVLFTSAGLIANPETVLDMDMAAHERVWRVNYLGTVHACRSFGRHMAARRAGAIVTVGSINSFMPLPLPAYNVGKAAVARLTQLLAVELGPRGVRVNSVAPTFVMTPPLRQRMDAGLRSEAKMMATHALKELPTPSDIAEAVYFLSSPAARAITGVTLPVDAGWLAAVSYNSFPGPLPASGA